MNGEDLPINTRGVAWVDAWAFFQAL